MVLPTFVIGGAPKAGTTALWAFLDAHPQVWMSPEKEPRFFTNSVPEPAPGVKAPPGRAPAYGPKMGLAWYESLFEGGADLPARGEASPQYIGAVDAPDAMERYAPGIKVVFALRQPTERAYSQYWWHRRRGLRIPPFAAVLDDHPALRYFVYMSRYAQHIERYRQALGSDRVHLVLFDDLQSDPSTVYRDLCRFIGVDDAYLPASFEEQYKTYRAPRMHWLQGILGQTRNRGLNRLTPGRLGRRLARVRRSIKGWNLSDAKHPPIDPTLFELLTERFEPDIAYVEGLTRPLPHWRELASRRIRPSTEVAAEQAT